jgi:hypothetical protein
VLLLLLLGYRYFEKNGLPMLGDAGKIYLSGVYIIISITIIVPYTITTLIYTYLSYTYTTDILMIGTTDILWWSISTQLQCEDDFDLTFI